MFSLRAANGTRTVCFLMGDFSGNTDGKNHENQHLFLPRRSSRFRIARNRDDTVMSNHHLVGHGAIFGIQGLLSMIWMWNTPCTAFIFVQGFGICPITGFASGYALAVLATVSFYCLCNTEIIRFASIKFFVKNFLDSGC